MVDSDPWQQLQMQTKDLDEESYDQQQGNDADPEQDLKQQKDIKKKAIECSNHVRSSATLGEPSNASFTTGVPLCAVMQQSISN